MTVLGFGDSPQIGHVAVCPRCPSKCSVDIFRAENISFQSLTSKRNVRHKNGFICHSPSKINHCACKYSHRGLLAWSLGSTIRRAFIFRFHVGYLSAGLNTWVEIMTVERHTRAISRSNQLVRIVAAACSLLFLEFGLFCSYGLVRTSTPVNLAPISWLDNVLVQFVFYLHGICILLSVKPCRMMPRNFVRCNTSNAVWCIARPSNESEKVCWLCSEKPGAPIQTKELFPYFRSCTWYSSSCLKHTSNSTPFEGLNLGQRETVRTQHYRICSPLPEFYLKPQWFGRNKSKINHCSNHAQEVDCRNFCPLWIWSD